MEQKEYLEIIEDWKLEHKDEVHNGKCKKVFIENLPKWKDGKNKGNFNWKECVGRIVHFIYYDIEGDVEIIDSVGKYLYIKYDKEETFKILGGGFINCKFHVFLNKRTTDFKIELGQRFQDDNRDITIIDRKKIKDKSGRERKYYKYKCNKCGFDCKKHWNIIDKTYREEIFSEESNLLKGCGCSCCCPTPRVIAENINSIYKTDPWMIPYIGEDCAKIHTYSSNDKVQVICPECGRIKDKKMSVVKLHDRFTINCSCSDGIKYPNKFAFKLLEQLNVEFETEYSPDWINLMSYDFYFKLNNKEYILEMDGGFHTKDNNMNGQSSEESKVIDDYKDEQAKLHGIEVIRVDCDYDSIENRFEYIKNNILDGKLNELFDLNKINWIKTQEFALSNRVKEACEYWKSGIHSTIQIGKIMKLSRETICKYLKEGTKLNWCNYSPEIGRKYRDENKYVSIICIEHDVIFKSLAECIKTSKNILGFNVNVNSLKTACNIGKIYKNCHWMYYKEYQKQIQENSTLTQAI